MMSKKQIEEQIAKEERLEIYSASVGDSQDARKHRAYREAFTLVIAD